MSFLFSKPKTSHSPFLRFWKCPNCENVDDCGTEGILRISVCPKCGTEITNANTLIGYWKITTYNNSLLLSLLVDDHEPIFEFIPKVDVKSTCQEPIMPESRTIKEFQFGRKDAIVFFAITITIFAVFSLIATL